MTLNANTIQRQSDITLDKLKNLPLHQQNARAHCNTWLQDIWPKIIDTTADVIDYANTFQASYQTLSGLVEKLKKGDKEAKKQFSEVLTQILIPALEEKKTESTKIASDTASLSSKFKMDYDNFEADCLDAKKAYTSEGGEVQKLQVQIDTLKAKVHVLHIEMIAVGIGEGLLILAMAVVDVLTEGAATEFLVGGISAGATLEGTLLSDYSSTMKDLGDLQNKMATLKNELTLLNGVEQQIKGFQKSLNDTDSASQAVKDGWTALADDLSKLIDQLEKITPEEAAVIITTQLNVANSDWGVVLEQAKVLQPTGQIPVKNFKGMKSFLDAIPK